jgi:hypothetical protein
VTVTSSVGATEVTGGAVSRRRDTGASGAVPWPANGRTRAHPERAVDRGSRRCCCRTCRDVRPSRLVHAEPGSEARGGTRDFRVHRGLDLRLAARNVPDANLVDRPTEGSLRPCPAPSEAVALFMDVPIVVRVLAAFAGGPAWFAVPTCAPSK